VSVLMSYVLISPARNEEKYIEHTLRSVASQTVPPVKWVIVSDGSTDRTDEIVGQYAKIHPFIRLLRLVPLLVLTYYYYRRLYRAPHIARSRDDHWLVWCFSAALVGWSIGTLTVSFVGQMGELASLPTGVACNMPEIVRGTEAADKQRQESRPAIQLLGK